MKIIGTGVDIVENSRIKKSILNNSFLNRVFTSEEILFSKNMKNKSSFFAKRFAAKEALSKALGTGIRDGINFKDIVIFNDNFGKPCIELKGTTANFLKKKLKNKKYSIYLSLSDDAPWAQATVIISYNQ